MKYREIILDCFRLPPSHPILATICIDAADWFKFQRLDADSPFTHIVGHDAPQNAKMVIYVGCASAAVRDRLENGWC